jgi:hypothetical protein
MLGTSTGYLTPFFREMLEHSSAASASCGIHFGLTKLVTSTCCSPAATRPSTSSIFVAVDTCMNCLSWQLCQSDNDCFLALQYLCYTCCFSFCNPSRGETSTRVTSVGRSKFPILCVSNEFVVKVCCEGAYSLPSDQHKDPPLYCHYVTKADQHATMNIRKRVALPGVTVSALRGAAYVILDQ